MNPAPPVTRNLPITSQFDMPSITVPDRLPSPRDIIPAIISNCLSEACDDSEPQRGAARPFSSNRACAAPVQSAHWRGDKVQAKAARRRTGSNTAVRRARSNGPSGGQMPGHAVRAPFISNPHSRRFDQRIEKACRLPDPSSRLINRTRGFARSSMPRMAFGLPRRTTKPSSQSAKVTTENARPPAIGSFDIVPRNIDLPGAQPFQRAGTVPVGEDDVNSGFARVPGEK